MSTARLSAHRSLLVLILTFVGVLVTGMALGATGSSAAPAPKATGDSAVLVTIPSTATPTPSTSSSPTPSPSSSGGSGGPGGGGPTPPPAEPTAPDVPDRPTAGARGLRVEPDRIVAGATVVVTGTGFTAGEQVQLVLYSDPVVIGSYPATFDGSIRVEIETPDELRLGIHTIEATGWVSEHVANDTLLVVSPAGAGFSIFPWIAWVVVGSVLVVALALYLLGVGLGWFPGLLTPKGATT